MSHMYFNPLLNKQRPYSKQMNPPLTMFGGQLSRVIKTKNGEYPLGTLVLSNAGWRSHYISNGEGGFSKTYFSIRIKIILTPQKKNLKRLSGAHLIRHWFYFIVALFRSAWNARRHCLLWLCQVTRAEKG